MAQRILVAEHEEELQSLARAYLEDGGFVVQAVASGQEAVQAAIGESPDLIVLDLMLPDMRGNEVFRRLQLQSLTADIPVVILVARGQASFANHAWVAGLLACLPTPFEPHQLLDLVRHLLTHPDGAAPQFPSDPLLPTVDGPRLVQTFLGLRSSEEFRGHDNQV